TMLLSPVGAQAPRGTIISGHPGDVLPIDGQATVLGKTWKDLLGIDLATKPGDYRISSTSILRVMPKRFPVRRLTVAPDFVTPPPEAMVQIAEDNKQTAAIWHRVTPRKWSGAFILPVDDQATSSFGTRSVFN